MDFLSQADNIAKISADGSLSKDQRPKIINDPVHGHMRIPRRVIDFIDTPQFQRLRDLKQLGTTYYVFPGASHNRFEHSIGVSYLAGSLLDRFQRMQPELCVHNDDTELIRIAGLCHDLGHGPFSHVWDGEFMTLRCPELNFHHEQMSLMMLDHLVDDNNIDIEKEDLQFVKDVIMASEKGQAVKKRREDGYLYEIVANGRNSIDVDKFDYIARDSQNCSVKSSFDHVRMMINSRVIDDEICYHSKEAMNIYGLFSTRYGLFKQVYTHRAAKSIEYMLTDALVEADIAWNSSLSKASADPREFQGLTDCILRDIERSRDDSLSKAQDIIRRIRTRRLYPFADEWLVPKSIMGVLKKVKPVDISTFSDGTLRPEDIIVQDFKINWCNRDSDPAERVSYFKNGDVGEKRMKMTKDKVAHLLPENFEERTLRVFCRDRDDSDKLAACSSALRRFIQSKTQCAISPNPHPSSRIHLSPLRGAKKPTLGKDFRSARVGRYALETIMTPPRPRKRVRFDGESAASSSKKSEVLDVDVSNDSFLSD